MRRGDAWGESSTWGESSAVTVQTSTTPTFRLSRAFKMRAVANTLLRMSRWFVLLATLSTISG